MTTLEQDLNDKSAFFYVAISFLLSRKKDSIIPEIMYFMKPEQVLQFIKTFEGGKVNVPTLKEFSLDLQCSLAAYLRMNKGYNWAFIQEKLDVDSRTITNIRKNIEEWNQYMKEQGIELPKILGET